MYPIIFEIGPLKLYGYGLMMAVGFILAIQWGVYRAKRYKVSGEFVNNLSMVLVIGGIIGGRVSFLAIEESVADVFSFKLFKVWDGGMVFYGGFIVAMLSGLVYCKKKGVDFFTACDVMGPPIALGHFFGRLGCLLAGCCYGLECQLPWAITFTHPASLAPLNVALHPTQIYEALGNLVIIGILCLVQKRQKYIGQVFVAYVALYAILRTYVETFRGDSERGFVTFGGIYENTWLSTSTLIGILMLVTAVAMHFVQRKKSI